MEERVHPIPFRTRKLSSPSPMILHISMWESRSTPGLFYALCALPMRLLPVPRRSLPFYPPHHIDSFFFASLIVTSLSR